MCLNPKIEPALVAIKKNLGPNTIWQREATLIPILCQLISNGRTHKRTDTSFYRDVTLQNHIFYLLVIFGVNANDAQFWPSFPLG